MIVPDNMIIVITVLKKDFCFVREMIHILFVTTVCFKFEFILKDIFVIFIRRLCP